MDTNTDSQQARELVDKAVSQLGEHFDSVRIFVTKQLDDGSTNTRAIDSGAGNFYAQLGQIREFIVIQDQYQKNWAIRKDKEAE